MTTAVRSFSRSEGQSAAWNGPPDTSKPEPKKRIENVRTKQIIEEAKNYLINTLKENGYKRLTEKDDFGVGNFYILVDYPDEVDPNKGGVIKIVETECFNDGNSLKWCNLVQRLENDKFVKYSTNITDGVWVPKYTSMLTKYFNKKNIKIQAKYDLSSAYVSSPGDVSSQGDVWIRDDVKNQPPPMAGGKKSKKYRKYSKSRRNKSRRNKSRRRKHKK